MKNYLYKLLFWLGFYDMLPVKYVITRMLDEEGSKYYNPTEFSVYKDSKKSSFMCLALIIRANVLFTRKTRAKITQYLENTYGCASVSAYFANNAIKRTPENYRQFWLDFISKT